MGSCATKVQQEQSSFDKCNDDIGKCNKELSKRLITHRLSIIEERNEFVRIDKLLSKYYQQFGINDYFKNNSKNGRFLQYIIDNKLININISTYLDLSSNKRHSNDLSFVYFDDNFPLNNDTLIYIKNNNINKEQVIFYVIQYCYKYDVYPSPNRFIQYMVLDTPRNSLRNIDKIVGKHKSMSG